MNNLFEQFENHVLFQTLANKIDFIKNALQEDSYNESQKESMLAYQLLLVIIQANLSSKALPMVNQAVLDNLNNSISNLSAGILTNINGYPSQYNSVMDWYKRIPTLEKKSEIKESFNSLIESFLIRQDEIEEKINSEVDNFQIKQNKQFDNWIAEKTKMQEEIDSLRIQNNELKTQIENFETEIKEQKDKIDNLINNFQVKFTNDEKEYNTRVEHLLSTQKNFADKTLSHLEKRKDEIEKLWGIIGKSATVGNASSIATKHEKLANKMMWITVILMSISLVIIAIATWKLFSGKYDYLCFVWKVLTTAIILVPAFYCANISKRQRDREFQLRDFEVKTAALEPFIENMILENKTGNNDTLSKDGVKLELTKTFFDKQFASINSSNDCILIPKELAKILNTLAKKCNLNINIGDEK